MTKDIICICNYHGRGGAQNNAARLVNGFKARGYDAELMFLFEREPDVSFEGINNKIIIADKKPRSLTSTISFLKSLYKELYKSNAKAVFGFFPMSNVVAGIFSPRSAEVVGTVRNPVTGENSEVTQSLVAGKLDMILGSTNIYRSIIAVSETVRKSCSDYPNKYYDKIVVIHNSTPKLPEVDDEKTECRRILRIPEDAKVLGFLGRLHHQKQPNFVIDIISEIKDDKTIVVIAGDGPERTDIERRIKLEGLNNRVILLGMISGADITRFYKAIDIYLFPSLYEGFGLTQIEAMSQGCPTITSDIEIMKEVGGEASIHLPLIVSEWVKSIDELFNDDVRQRAIEDSLKRSKIFQDETIMIDGYLKAAGLPLYKEQHDG